MTNSITKWQCVFSDYKKKKKKGFGVMPVWSHHSQQSFSEEAPHLRQIHAPSQNAKRSVSPSQDKSANCSLVVTGRDYFLSGGRELNTSMTSSTHLNKMITYKTICSTDLIILASHCISSIIENPFYA